MSSRAQAQKPVSTCSTTRASANWPSQAQRKSVFPLPKLRPKNSSRPRSSSAANPRTSSSRTATSNKLMMVPSSASSSIRDRSAALVRASSSRRISMTNSWQSSSTASIKSRLACRGRKTHSSVRQSIKRSSIRSSPMSNSPKKKVRPSPAAVNGQLTVCSRTAS